MQSVSSRIWTRVAVSISYVDNHYTPRTSNQPTNQSSVFDMSHLIWSMLPKGGKNSSSSVGISF